jgi:hypothetical protein
VPVPEVGSYEPFLGESDLAAKRSQSWLDRLLIDLDRMR